MPEEQTLPLSTVVQVSIQTAAVGLGLENINTLALLTRETTPGSWAGATYKIYVDPSDVLTDWGSASPVTKIAAKAFAQQPGFLTTGGYLVVIPILPTVALAASRTVQDLVLTAKTAGVGGNSITLKYTDAPPASKTIQSLTYTAADPGAAGNDIAIAYTTGATAGAEVVTVVGKTISVQIDSGNSSATQVKAAIDAESDATDLVSVAIVTGQGDTKQTAPVSATYLEGGVSKGGEVVSVDSFDITVLMVDGESSAAEIKEAIDESGAASALISVALVAGHETDAQNAFTPAVALTGGSAASSETFEATIARMKNAVFFFGVCVDVILTENELTSLATYVQGLDKMLFYASRTAADFAPGGMLDLLRSGSLSHTRGLYYYGALAGDTQGFAASYGARLLSTDFTGQNTAQTMHLKTLAGFTPDQTIDETALAAAKAAGVDVYGSIAGSPSLLTSGENAFADQVYNSLWLKNAIQTSCFNLLRQTNTKIPQTEEGMQGLKGVVLGVLKQAVDNGYLAPGAWSSPTVFGNPADLIRNITDVGYYIYSKPVAQQLQADRDARVAPLVQVAAKEAGALHSASIIVNLNR